MRFRHQRGARTWLPALFAGLLIVLAIGVFAAGCGGTGGTATTAAGAGGPQVIMKGFAFNPASITIKVGQTVTWTNQDGSTHNVTADNKEFDSSDVAPGASFSFTFTKAGTYPYTCTIHPSMKGTVVVQ